MPLPPPPPPLPPPPRTPQPSPPPPVPPSPPSACVVLTTTRTKLDPPLNCWKSSSILFPENGYDINLCHTYYQVSLDRGDEWTFTPCYRDGDWCRQAGEA